MNVIKEHILGKGIFARWFEYVVYGNTDIKSREKREQELITKISCKTREIPHSNNSKLHFQPTFFISFL